MTLKFVIEPPEEAVLPRNIQKSISLNARKSVDGNIMIFDHDLIDIVIMPNKSKIITFMKSSQNDLAYETQDRFFKFLHRRGLIIGETIKSGNVFGSIEGEYPSESDYADPFSLSLMLISEFVQDEKRFMDSIDYVSDMERERMLEPDAEDSTELGEVPHADKKGTLGSIDYYPAYYYGAIYDE